MFGVLIAAAAALSPSPYSIDEPMHAPAAAPSWSDEFNGTALDRSKWSFDTSRNKIGWYNDEKEYYSGDRAANLRLENGSLIIVARHDPAVPRRDRRIPALPPVRRRARGALRADAGQPHRLEHRRDSPAPDTVAGLPCSSR